jgi:hypothetical protein
LEQIGAMAPLLRCCSRRLIRLEAHHKQFILGEAFFSQNSRPKIKVMFIWAYAFSARKFMWAYPVAPLRIRKEFDTKKEKNE